MEPLKVEVTPEGEILCAWTPGCGRPAGGVVSHSILEAVPTCARCAERMGAVLAPATWSLTEIEDEEPDGAPSEPWQVTTPSAVYMSEAAWEREQENEAFLR